VRSFLTLAELLLEGNLAQDAFEAVRYLDDGPLNELDKSKLAGKMVENWPEVPIFCLLYGQSLMRLGIKSQARDVFEKGLGLCSQQADVKTCLLFSLATIYENPEEKKQLLQDAYSLNGDLTAAAMAYVSLTLQI
jgi:GMP synthase PP-ATPase subunit